MAIYHCHCKIISRGKALSAVGAAAYRSGERLTNDYDGKTHDYTKKGGVVYSEVMLCENAPQKYQNRAVLWNEVERQEKGAKAQLAREYEVALPVELSRDEQIKFTRDFVKDNFVKNGMCADFSIHDKGDGNPHAHILLTVRPIEKDGTWGAKATNEYVLDKNGNRIIEKIDKSRNKKIYKRRKIDTTDWGTKDFLNRVRADLSSRINAELERKKLPQRVDHRSLKAQGKEQIPTQHIGVSAAAMEKRGIASDRGDENRAILSRNAEIRSLTAEIEKTQLAVDYARDDMQWDDIHSNIAYFEKRLDAECGDLSILKQREAEIERLSESIRAIAPSSSCAGRTVEYDLRQIPYYDYHKNKAIADTANLRDKIKQYILTHEQRASEQITPTEPRRNSISAPQKTEQLGHGFNSSAAARQLAAYRSAFVEATMQRQQRSTYTPNINYEQEARQIEFCRDKLSELHGTIMQLEREKSGLGVFKAKEKKIIDGKIQTFRNAEREYQKQLAALGVSGGFDRRTIDEAIKGKRDLAAAELAKVEAARQSESAGAKADEAKRLFLELARTVPESCKPEVREQMKEQAQGTGGSVRNALAFYQAEVEARQQLDNALKLNTSREDRNRGKNIERGDR